MQNHAHYAVVRGPYCHSHRSHCGKLMQHGCCLVHYPQDSSAVYVPLPTLKGAPSHVSTRGAAQYRPLGPKSHGTEIPICCVWPVPTRGNPVAKTTQAALVQGGRLLPNCCNIHMSACAWGRASAHTETQASIVQQHRVTQSSPQQNVCWVLRTLQQLGTISRLRCHGWHAQTPHKARKQCWSSRGCSSHSNTVMQSHTRQETAFDLEATSSQQLHLTASPHFDRTPLPQLPHPYTLDTTVKVTPAP
jgi:hypothetical protein